MGSISMKSSVTGSRAVSREPVQDRRGRAWTVSVVAVEQAEEEDARFWAEMSPEERVARRRRLPARLREDTREA